MDSIGDNPGREKVRTAFDFPPFDMEEVKTLWDRTCSKKPFGFVKGAKGLFRVLDFAEWGMLHLLVDWLLFKVSRLPEALEAQNGWFFCSDKTIANMVPSSTKHKRRTLIASLERKGFITTHFTYGTKRVEGGRKFNNHRWMYIHFDRILKAVEKAARKAPKTTWSD